MASYQCECGLPADWFIKPDTSSDRRSSMLGRATCDEHLARDMHREFNYYKQAGLSVIGRVFRVTGYKEASAPAAEDTTE